LNIAKLEKKFARSKSLSYLEISKPNLRNNLKQLFAMNNSFFIPATLVAIFFAVSAICILDTAPRPTGDVVKSQAQLFENHIVEGMIARQQAKLDAIKKQL